MKILTSLTMPVLLSALALTTPVMVRSQEHIGTSCADCPNLSGQFSLENQTGVTVRYRVRWGGDNHPWRSYSLNTGTTETHSYPLDGNGRAPTPHVVFDRIGGDSQYTAKEYRMEFYAVGYSGYGARTNTSGPKKYYFKYGPDGKSLDILAR